MRKKWHIDEICRKKLLYKKEMKGYLNSWPWDWFVSFNFGYSQINIVSAQRAIRKWAISLGIRQRLQIAYMGVMNQNPFSHVHLFILGRNRNRDTLVSVNPTMWELRWPGDVKIKKINSKAGAIAYVVDRNMPDGQYELLTPYGKKHLEKYVSRTKKTI